MIGSTREAEATLHKRVALSFYQFCVSNTYNTIKTITTREHVNQLHVRSLTSRAFFYRNAFLLTLLAFSMTALTCDVADDSPWIGDGPGLTFDESFNVEVGVYLTHAYAQAGIAALHPATSYDIYSHPAYNPDHPPLGRLLLGLSEASLHSQHHYKADQHRYILTYARVGSAFAFALTILIVTLFTSRWYGEFAGIAAGASLLLSPRLFAHAHLASLESATNLTFAAFVLFVSHTWGDKHKLRWQDGIWPGVLIGLALLTKMHAVFLPPLFVIWAIWNWRFNAILPILCAGFVSFIVFFVGWPWLWIDPVNHFIEYFARSTERSIVYCYYFGERYADREVPWHYPWVMFVVTTPVFFLFSAIVGCFARSSTEGKTINRRSMLTPRGQLVLLGILFPLIVFTLPVTKYDGARLFLMSWPFLAIFTGIGTTAIMKRVRLPLQLLITIVFLSPLYSLVTLHPVQLSYYSLLIGGLRGANSLGMEATYWGDAVTPQFLREVSDLIPAGATLEVAPVLHPLQLEFMRTNSWLRHRPDITLSPYDHNRTDLSPYVLVIRRQADPWSSLTPPPPGTEVLLKEQRRRVVLTELLKLPEDH